MGKNLETLTDRQRDELTWYKEAAADWCLPGGIWGDEAGKTEIFPRVILEDFLPPLGSAEQLEAALAAGNGRQLINYLFVMREKCEEIAATSEAFLHKWGRSVPPSSRPYKGL